LPIVIRKDWLVSTVAAQMHQSDRKPHHQEKNRQLI
jgi:hypothetical protein